MRVAFFRLIRDLSKMWRRPVRRPVILLPACPGSHWYGSPKAR